VTTTKQNLELNVLIFVGFGEVWKCEWRETIVAVKKLQSHWIEANPTVLEEFEQEVKFLRTIRHPHIVLFFGAGYTEEGPFLVTGNF